MSSTTTGSERITLDDLLRAKAELDAAAIPMQPEHDRWVWHSYARRWVKLHKNGAITILEKNENPTP